MSEILLLATIRVTVMVDRKTFHLRHNSDSQNSDDDTLWYNPLTLALRMNLEITTGWSLDTKEACFKKYSRSP